jgi:hypothetical protein
VYLYLSLSLVICTEGTFESFSRSKLHGNLAFYSGRYHGVMKSPFPPALGKCSESNLINLLNLMIDELSTPTFIYASIAPQYPTYTQIFVYSGQVP